ncbi:MAG TPA: transcriptional regulator/antitoxin, MazE [Blastocatellia bacterium]|nr:transcriptional regulator/antitoxin, MazE [Blastocatellia bacterium]
MIRKRCHSRALRLSERVLHLAGIAVGADAETVGDRQSLVKMARRTKYDLAELISRIPKGYKAREVSFGPPVGKEVW